MNVLSIFRKAFLILAVGLLPLAAQAVTLVQTKTGTVTTGGVTSTSLVLTLTSAVTSGDGVALGFTYGAVGGTPSVTSITDDKGNTYTADQNDLDPFSGSFKVVAHSLNITNGAQTVTITIASTATTSINCAGAAYELSGATAIDVTNIGTHTSSASALVVSMTTAAANEFAMVVLLPDVGAATWTQNNGWTQDENDTFTGGSVFHNTLTASGANSLNMTPSTSVHSAWSILTFSGSGGGAAALAGAASDAVTATGALTTTAAPFAPILLDNAAHAGGSDNVGMGTGPNTGTGDTAETAFTKLKQWAIDANAMMAQLYPVRSLQTPTTGFTVAAAAGVTQLVLNPAGTLATGTVTLPKAPGDNQPFALATSQTITSLTVNTSDGSTINGAPTTLSANSGVKYRYVLSLNTWFREQ